MTSSQRHGPRRIGGHWYWAPRPVALCGHRPGIVIASILSTGTVRQVKVRPCQTCQRLFEAETS